MSRKIRVIIKRPDERYGHVCNISSSLENMQKTVGGYIETVALTNAADGQPIVLVCNEEGKLRNLEHNFYLYDDEIVGTVFLCGVNDGDLSDLPITFGLAEWKKLLDEMRWK